MLSFKVSRWVWALGGLAALAIALAVCFAPEAPSSSPAATSAGKQAHADALRQIAAESSGPAPVRSEPAPRRTPLEATPPTPPAPPAGYSFPTFHEMALAQPPPGVRAMIAPARDASPDPLATPQARQLLVQQAAAAGRDWAYGWIRLAEGATRSDAERILPAHGARVLGGAGELLRAELPADAERLAAIAALPQVVGVGALPKDAKMPPQLAAEALERPYGNRAALFVTLMANHDDGRWRRAMERMGGQVGWFDADTRAYVVAIAYERLEELTSADWVLAVEPVGRVAATLHSAAPAMGVDALRDYNLSSGLFEGIGGAAVPIGVMDTGLNISHLDIASNRRSVCGANFEPRAIAREEDMNLWADPDGHGTHVTGIFVGNGTVDPRNAGMAPLVRDIRFAKALSGNNASAIGWSRAQDWLSRATACGPHPAVKPLVLNSSLGVSATLWEARTVVERKVDAVVWRARQLFAIAAGNAADSGQVNYAAAKNTLAVGAVGNNGRIANFSSRGPTSDGRLLPHVVGSGVDVASPVGGGSQREYVAFSGTSMASPAVAGVAALVLDVVPGLRERPAATRALLMASAIKPDAFFEQRDVPWLINFGRGRFRLDNGDGPGALQNAYGLGKVSARTSVLARDEADGWVGGAAAVDVAAGSFGYHDIVVPAGAARLDVVLAWDEPAAETISNPVFNDLDLWVDRGTTCRADDGPCGDHASRSAIDNVEWVILPNPPPGTYRLKAVPRRMAGVAPRAGIGWTVIRGPSTPTLNLTADQPVVTAPLDRAFDIGLALSVDGYVASGASVRVDCRARRGSSACSMVEFLVPHVSTASREDGLTRSLGGESSASIVVGEVGAGEQQRLRLRVKGRPEADNFHLHFTATAWNGTAASTAVEVRVGESDNPAPQAAGRPPNDDFANAVQLAGERGVASPVHILLATAEPGEPTLGDESEARPRSVWYRWTAPATGPARFTIGQAQAGELSDDVELDLYSGDRLVSLRRLGLPKLGGGMVFFAEAGATYAIRLSIGSNLIANPTPGGPLRYETAPVELRWAPGTAPANDDFRSATALTEGDSIAGNNQGATLEEGELVGQDFPLPTFAQEGISASVWYRWTAPATGDWAFAVNRRHLRVLAFVGENAASARLVSGAPGLRAVFPALEGGEYRIAVVTENALYGGTDFRLTWAPGRRTGSQHDDFAGAEPIVEQLHESGFDLGAATVEPGEPAVTGSRTAWWSWDAPADGEFTWAAQTNYVELEEFFGFIFEVPANFSMRFAAFSGDSLATLAPLAVRGTDDWTHTEFTFDAEAGQRYWFSVGLPRDAALATITTPVETNFRWGQTPPNDSLAGAMALQGDAGSVAGSNRFATVELGEKTGVHGDSSLWWTWEPPQGDVWYRFALESGDGVLTVYKVVGAGFEGLEPVAVGSSRVGRNEAVFQAEEGARYVIRLGVRDVNLTGDGNDGRGDFTIGWDVFGTPAWLRYAGAVFVGQLDDEGVALALPTVIGGAFHSDGRTFYANTEEGLRVFRRDVNTGGLALAQAVEPVGPVPAALLWDDASGHLIAASCEGWQTFAHGVDADGLPNLQHAGALEGAAPCAATWWNHIAEPRAARAAFLAPGGGFVGVVQENQAIETYALDVASGTLAHVDTFENSALQHAAAHRDGRHVYAVTDEQVLVLQRDAATGALALALALPENDGMAEWGGEDEGPALFRTLALDDNGQYLYAFAEAGLRTLVFDLREDAAQPRFVGGVRVASGSTFYEPTEIDDCLGATVRPNGTAVDVFCTGFLYTVALTPDGGVRQTDFLQPGLPDRFGNRLPLYESYVQYGLASPDGKHLYGIFAQPAMVVFERVSGF